MRIVLFVAVAILASSMNHAVGDDKEIEKRAERLAKLAQRIDVEAAQGNLLECQAVLRYAMATKDTELARKANGEIKDAKRELARARARKASDYMERALGVARSERGQPIENDDLKDTGHADLTPGEFALERIRHAGPLFIGAVMLQKNAIGVPEVTVHVGNRSDRTIEAFDVEIECWNSFGEPVRDRDDNIMQATCQTPIDEADVGTATWMLAVQDTTTHVAVRITRIKPAYGQTWGQTREEAERSPGAIVEAKMRR